MSHHEHEEHEAEERRANVAQADEAQTAREHYHDDDDDACCCRHDHEHHHDDDACRASAIDESFMVTFIAVEKLGETDDIERFGIGIKAIDEKHHDAADKNEQHSMMTLIDF